MFLLDTLQKTRCVTPLKCGSWLMARRQSYDKSMTGHGEKKMLWMFAGWASKLIKAHRSKKPCRSQSYCSRSDTGRLSMANHRSHPAGRAIHADLDAAQRTKPIDQAAEVPGSVDSRQSPVDSSSRLVASRPVPDWLWILILHLVLATRGKHRTRAWARKEPFFRLFARSPRPRGTR